MKKCSECGSKVVKLSAKTPEGVGYDYFKCQKCGEEILNMSQLHAVAEKYREIKRYNAKLSKWGQSLGLRIPKTLAKKYKFKEHGEVIIIPDKQGIRVLPA